MGNIKYDIEAEDEDADLRTPEEKLEDNNDRVDTNVIEDRNAKKGHKTLAQALKILIEK